MTFNDWLKTQGLRYDYGGNDGDIRWTYDGKATQAGYNDDTGSYDAYNVVNDGENFNREYIARDVQAQDANGRIVGDRYYIGDDPNEIAATEANWSRYGYVPSMLQTDENGYRYVQKDLGQTFSGRQFADSGTNRGDIMDMGPMILAAVMTGGALSGAFAGGLAGAEAALPFGSALAGSEGAALLAPALEGGLTAGAIPGLGTGVSFAATPGATVAGVNAAASGAGLTSLFGDLFAPGLTDAATGGLTAGSDGLINQAIQMPYEPPAQAMTDFAQPVQADAAVQAPQVAQTPQAPSIQAPQEFTPPSVEAPTANVSAPSVEVPQVSNGLDPMTTGETANPWSSNPSSQSLEGFPDLSAPQTPNIQSYSVTPNASGSYTIDVPTQSMPLDQVPYGTDLGGAKTFMDTLRTITQVPTPSPSLFDKVRDSLTSPQGVAETLKIGGGLISGIAAPALAKQKAEAEAAAQAQAQSTIAANNRAGTSFGGVRMNLRPTGLLLRTPNVKRVGV